MTSADLYKQEITGPFAKLCGGGTNDGNMEDCVMIAPLDGGGFALQDSKLGEESPELRFNFTELKSLGDKIATLTA